MSLGKLNCPYLLKCFIISLLFLATLACEEDKQPITNDSREPSNTVAPQPPKRVEFKKSPSKPKRSYLERKYLPESELFGKFFQDRIQFHIVKDPDLTLYKTKVKELTFYHIDDELSKKKFEMAGDISSDLVAVFGNFKLRPLDSVSVVIAKSEPIIKSNDQGKYINENLRNFEMRWEKTDKTIRFKTKTDSLGAKTFVYSEENSDYKFMFQSIQNGIGIEAIEEITDSP